MDDLKELSEESSILRIQEEELKKRQLVIPPDCDEEVKKLELDLNLLEYKISEL